jgi:molybdenum cofactor biosynthesis protein B
VSEVHGRAPAATEGGLHEHRRAAPEQVPTVVVTVSDTRTLETDTGGALVAELLQGAGHPVLERRIVRDEPAAIVAALEAALARADVRAVIFTGGTGVAPRDLTPDAVEPRLERVVPGFGELFRMLSFQEIGSAALLSRALAGLVAGRVVFVLPGSRGAVRLALERLVLPELGHLAAEAVKRR